MLELKNATLAYSKDYDALLDVNMVINNGERVALVGPAGSGKTALLRVIAGLETLKCGGVYYDDVPQKKVNFLHGVSLGYLSSRATFFERKSVYKNFMWILKTRKYPKKTREPIIRQVLEDFEISYLADMKVNSLSPLERRQVQMARLAMRPLDILLVDDILEGNDEDLTREVKKSLGVLISKQPAESLVLISSSNEDLVDDLVTRKYYIDSGSVSENQTPEKEVEESFDEEQ